MNITNPPQRNYYFFLFSPARPAVCGYFIIFNTVLAVRIPIDSRLVLSVPSSLFFSNIVSIIPQQANREKKRTATNEASKTNEHFLCFLLLPVLRFPFRSRCVTPYSTLSLLFRYLFSIKYYNTIPVVQTSAKNTTAPTNEVQQQCFEVFCCLYSVRSAKAVVMPE